MNQLSMILAQAANPGPSGRGVGLGPGASTFMDDVDPVWNFLFWTSVFFTLLIIGLMVLFILKYRQKDKNDLGSGPTHSTPLELTWTAIPLVLVLAFFAVGFRGYVDMSEVPDEGTAEQIIVESYKWGWNFQYTTDSGIVNSSTLYVPKDEPVRLILQSSDVIHSFYVPAFRIKKDCVPGRYNQTWFQATENGEYDLFCAEYCGQKHSAMVTTVQVMDREQYETKLAELSDPTKTPPLELARNIYDAQCSACHSIDGTAMIGPTFKNLYGREAQMAGESEPITADADYIRESILYPNERIVRGYQAQMPSYLGRLREAEILALTEWIKTLSPDTYDGPVMKKWEQRDEVEEAAEGEGESEASPDETSDDETSDDETSPDAPTAEPADDQNSA